MKRTCAPLLALCLLLLFTPWVQAAGTGEVTVLFTHDLHSHFLPQPTESGGSSGGYARLKTAIDRERAVHPDAVLVDGGDFSIGSLIQTLYITRAAELRTMGAMGYDAVTFGNHEFDHTGAGFADMLTAAADSGDPLPALLDANYTPAPEHPDRERILRAMEDCGVTESLILERGGVTFGLFGIMGLDSHDCAPSSGFVLEDRARAAERCAADLRDRGAEVVVCLSHSGTEGGRGEDYDLARAVDGIDVIVSGHTHTTLAQPIRVEDTWIVSAGPYCENLGSLTLTRAADGTLQLAEYHLVPIDETLPEDPEIAALVEEWKEQVGETYLRRFGLTYDQVLTSADFALPLPASDVQTGNALGELTADAFLWAAENLEQDAPDVPTVTVTASGVLRAPLGAGEITASMAFDVLSMGVGSDGTSGFPLVACYLTGRELKAVAEVDASVTPLMPAAQLYTAGLAYRFNPRRMLFDRVREVRVYEEDFSAGPAPVSGGGAESGAPAAQSGRVYREIEDGRLYRVISGMYSAQMLGTVKGKSLGLLSLEPKRADGTPVTDFESCILRDRDGGEIKEWTALAAYLRSFGDEGVPARYAAADGRKTVSRSWSPAELLGDPGWPTLAVLGGAAVLCVLALLAFHGLRRRRGRRC